MVSRHIIMSLFLRFISPHYEIGLQSNLAKYPQDTINPMFDHILLKRNQIIRVFFYLIRSIKVYKKILKTI